MTAPTTAQKVALVKCDTVTSTHTKAALDRRRWLMKVDGMTIISDAAKAEIGKCYGTLMNGYQKGEWKVTSQIYGPNCTILSPGKPTIKGREAAENYWRQLKEETGVTKIEIKCEEMNGSGDWFFERGAYKLYKGDRNFQDRKLVFL